MVPYVEPIAVSILVLLVGVIAGEQDSSWLIGAKVNSFSPILGTDKLLD